MAGATGLEPATSGVTGRRSKPTELHPRVILPSLILVVGDDGIEPPTLSV
ncbi:uncharacterized protein METZ01_LOCUS211783 [marine metagenome]|uniref:Uncharacterized protein n=1 Tax=marine metagenome TaxID=408172 RepID=A0A382F8C8_9ZZZZ